MASVRKTLMIVVVAAAVVAVGAFASLLAYSAFVDRVQGAPTRALAPPTRLAEGGALTRIDELILPQTLAHPGQTGLALLTGNTDAFAARALSARHAGRSLDLQYYLWHDDLTGRLLAAEALAAADRGVRVRLLVDDMSAHGTDGALRILADHPNIDVRMFNPSRNRGGSIGRAVEMLFRGVSLNRRMHNKAWIVDGQLAIVGGRNIGDEYFDAAEDTNFLDADVLLLGPAVGQTATIFDEYWASAAVVPIEALAEPGELSLDELRARLMQVAQSEQAQPYMTYLARARRVHQLIHGDATLHWDTHARVYSDPADKALGVQDMPRWLITPIMKETRAARESLILISPYFVPGAQGTLELTGLARAGVEIDILTNSLASNDVMAVHSGYARYRRALLGAGVQLHELMPFGDTSNSLFGSSGASLHTKAFTVDGSLGFVGSFNFDPRSVQLNTEMGVMFHSEALVAEINALYRLHSASDKSYGLSLDRGEVRWQDARQDPPRIWRTEPETTVWQRLIVELLGWLPIEQQL